MDYKDKINVLMKFWGRTETTRIKDSLFFGWKFQNMEEYLDILGKYYGISDMKQHMMKEVQEILDSEHKYHEYNGEKCDINIDLIDWNLENYPVTIEYGGYGGKPTMKFKYYYNSDLDVPKDWMDQTIIEILEQVDDHQDPIKFIKDEMTTYIFDAYDDSFTFPKIYKALKYIRKKYGLGNNIESGFRDYSEIERLIDRYSDIAVSKLPTLTK